MNIFTFPAGGTGNMYVRPDTVICRDDADTASGADNLKGSKKYEFFVPDGVLKISVIPFIFVKIQRPCKALAARFARRHFSECGYGIHLTAANSVTRAGKYVSSSIDNSTFLSMTSDLEEFPFKEFSSESTDFNLAVEKASMYMTLRTGDMIAVEFPEFQKITESTTVNFKEISIKISF